MNFWEAKRQRQKITTYYLLAFATLTILTAIGCEVALRSMAQDSYNEPFPFFGVGFLIVTFLVAYYNYSMYQAFGGSYVAESIGAKRVLPETGNYKEQQLLNIVEEVALAANLPMPAVYIIPAAQINAFAAGLSPESSAIAISAGALEVLNRDEIQGVIAHEFGHISNGDMVISLRLAAMLMGFFFVLYLGLRFLQISSYSRSRSSNGNQKGGNPLIIGAVILLGAGLITWALGSILKSMVSRQREYLADASAVQFTRSVDGILGALIKIRDQEHKPHDMPKEGTAYSHMYFDHASFGGLFATHPPIEKRIEVLVGERKGS